MPWAITWTMTVGGKAGQKKHITLFTPCPATNIMKQKLCNKQIASFKASTCIAISTASTPQDSKLKSDQSDPSMLSSMLSSKRILQKTGTDNPSDKPGGICELEIFQQKQGDWSGLANVFLISPDFMKKKITMVSNPWGLMISKTN